MLKNCKILYNTFRKMSFRTHCRLAFLIRVILVVYANFHDKYFSVRYTDVDYKVFTDAARYMLEGGSPFQSVTYRYTPLLSLLLTPNIFLHHDFGKIIFSMVDIVVAILIRNILERQKCKTDVKDMCVYAWMYNPLTIIISTRGNADSLAALLVILTLDLMQRDKIISAGLLHGLSVHFRLYPIVFSLAMFLSLRRNNIVPNKDQLKLIIACVSSFVTLTYINYCIYGYEFLYESFIYHILRKDVRHNFSVYFYMLYLSVNQSVDLFQKILLKLPQLLVLLALSYRYSNKAQLPFAMFTQAMLIVMYNSVITSQYFFWFLSLLPLCLPNIKMELQKFVQLTFVWFISQGIWLFAAYLLEFQGLNTFLYIWIAGLIFFLVNATILVEIINCYKLN